MIYSPPMAKLRGVSILYIHHLLDKSKVQKATEKKKWTQKTSIS